MNIHQTPHGLGTHNLSVPSGLIIINIYDLQSEDWINTYYDEGHSMGTQATQSINEMKSTNEKMTLNTQDMNLSWYVPTANVDHTIRAKALAP